MSEMRMGWWTWQRVDAIEMMEDDVFGQSIWRDAPLDGEALAAARALHGDGLDWWRFDYFDDDFRAALAVGWSASRDRIVVDHRLMPLLPPPVAAPGTEARLLAAPDAPIAYGAWCRIDDAAIEAFRIWPSARTVGDGPGRLTLHGGWFGGAWSDTLTRAAITFPPDLMMAANLAQARHPPREGRRTPLDAVARRWSAIPRSEFPSTRASDIVLGCADMLFVSHDPSEGGALLVDRGGPELRLRLEVARDEATGDPICSPAWRLPFQHFTPSTRTAPSVTFFDLRTLYDPRDNAVTGLDYDRFHGVPEEVPTPVSARSHRRDVAAAVLAAARARAGDASTTATGRVRLRHWHWIGNWLPMQAPFGLPDAWAEVLPPTFRDHDVTCEQRIS